MKKYYISNEEVIEVKADSAEEAIEKARNRTNWNLPRSELKIVDVDDTISQRTKNVG